MAAQPSARRGGVAFIFIVLLGYLIGYFIKNVRAGLLIGLALGFLASGIFRRR